MAAARTARARPQIPRAPTTAAREESQGVCRDLVPDSQYLDCHRHAAPVELSYPRTSSGRSSRIGSVRTASPSESGRADWYWRRCVVQPAHDEAAGHARQQQHPHELAMYSIEYTIGRAKPYRARSTRLTAPCSPRREQLNHGIVPLTRRRPAAPPTSCSRQIRAFRRRRHSTRGIGGRSIKTSLACSRGSRSGVAT
jgi:hypothetical protein